MGIGKKKFKGSGKAKVLTAHASPYRNELSEDEEIKMFKEQIRVLQQGIAKSPSSTDLFLQKLSRISPKFQLGKCLVPKVKPYQLMKLPLR